MEKIDASPLTVIIAASNDNDLLEVCLTSLIEHDQDGAIEIIVVSNYEGVNKLIASRFPVVRHLEMPKGTTVPMMRTRGIQAATGTLIALSEDNVVFDAEWSQAVLHAHAEDHPIVGGTVENCNGDRAHDWAVYFYEYGRYMAPNEPGPAPSLAGNNVSYLRGTLDEVSSHFETGFYEVFINAELQRRGYMLYMEPSAKVYHTKTYHVASVLRQCYHHGRGFAGMREANRPLWHRAGMGMAALALPLLLPFRIAAQTISKGAHLRELARALPYLLLFMSAWALGEFMGYVAGVGDSAKEWT